MYLLSLIECPVENQFPCQDAEGNPQCISELQYCDNVSDCADGTDEPTDCLSGIVCIIHVHTKQFALSTKCMQIMWHIQIV